MEVNEKNLNLLNDENKFKFGYLCVKHVFSRVKPVVIRIFKDSEEKRPIEVIKLVEKWLNDPNSVSVEELSDAASAASDTASAASDTAWAASAARAAANAAWAARAAAWAASVAWAASAAVWAASAAVRAAARAAGAAGAAASAAASVKEQKWQERLLDYLSKQQNMQSKLGNPDDPLELARELVHKVDSGEIKKDELGYRTQIHNYLKNLTPEDKEMVLYYLKNHQVYENLKKIIKEEIMRMFK